MNEIANSNLTLSHNATAATIAITNLPSTKNFTSTFASWFEKISLSLSLVQTAVITDGNGTGSGDILPTSSKVNENGKKVLRKDDQVSITCSGTAGGSPVTDSVTVTIQNAGQTKAIAL